MDFGDIGLESTEANTNAAINRVRAEARTQAFKVTGICYNVKCQGDSVDRPFCSKECRDEYDYMNRKR